MERRLRDAFEELDRYFIPDEPYLFGDGIPALGAHYLSGDLAALYVWLERGLVIFDYENDDALADATWHWVGGFEFEHGDVLVAAVLATYWATQRSPN